MASEDYIPFDLSEDDLMADVDQHQPLSSGDAATHSVPKLKTKKSNSKDSKSKKSNDKESKGKKSKVKKPKANNTNPFMPSLGMPDAIKEKIKKRKVSKSKAPKARLAKLLPTDGFVWIKFGRYKSTLHHKVMRPLNEALRAIPNINHQTCDRELAGLFQHATQHVHLLDQEKNPRAWWGMVIEQGTFGTETTWSHQEDMPRTLDDLACRAVLARKVYLSLSPHIDRKDLSDSPSAFALAVDAYIAAIRAGPGATDLNVRRNMLERFVVKKQKQDGSWRKERTTPLNEGSVREKWREMKLTVHEHAVIVPDDATKANTMSRELVGLFEAFELDDEERIG